MPPVRTYIVTQTREVKIRTDSPANAVIIGTSAFDGETPLETLEKGTNGSWSDVDLRVTEITAREEY